MESATALRSFSCNVSHLQAVLEKPRVVSIFNATSTFPNKPLVGGLAVGPELASRRGMVLSCVKTSGAAGKTKSEDSSSSNSQASVSKNKLKRGTFPNGFEELLLEVCDETEVAELKVKVGDFEMHVKRSIGATAAPLSGISPTTPPPIPTEPMTESVPAPPTPSPSKASSEKSNASKIVQSEKSSKLAALEASGASGFVVVSSPTVGSFSSGRTVKGKKQPSICAQGNQVKEGQVIGYVDQFGNQLPVKSDVAGEVLRVLVDDGEPVGYGDPLIAVLPSFPGINLE